MVPREHEGAQNPGVRQTQRVAELMSRHREQIDSCGRWGERISDDLGRLGEYSVVIEGEYGMSGDINRRHETGAGCWLWGLDSRFGVNVVTKRN